MDTQVREALGRVLMAYVEQYQPRVEHDPEWPSPCVVGEPDEDDLVAWRPVPMDDPPGTGEVAAAVGAVVHPDAVEFLTSWWAGEVEGSFDGEMVFLRTLWNREELDTALADLRQHLEVQGESGIPARTVPIAGTGSDFYFGLDNRTGEVYLDEPGHPPLRTVAPSLAAFLYGLTV